MPKQVKNRREANDDIVIGSAGRLFPVKDYLLMVEIAKDLCARRDNVHFVLAGDGPDREKIIRKIQEYGISDRFNLLGHLDEMGDFYSMIDIYLNTLHHEGLPMTIIEAMAHSIPVVAPHVGGFPEVVGHGKTGWLVKNRNESEFARTIEDMISNKGAMAVAGESARERVQGRFSIECMSESYVNMYLDLVR